MKLKVGDTERMKQSEIKWTHRFD